MLYWILGGVSAVAFGFLGYNTYLLIRELLPTLKQARSLNALIQVTTAKVQEITPVFQSISQQINVLSESGRYTSDRAKEVIQDVVKITGLRRSAMFFLSNVNRVDWQELRRKRRAAKVIEEIKEKAHVDEISDKVQPFLQKLRHLKAKAATRLRKRYRTRSALRRALPFAVGTAVGGLVIYLTRNAAREDYYYEYLPDHEPRRPNEAASVPRTERRNSSGHHTDGMPEEEDTWDETGARIS